MTNTPGYDFFAQPQGDGTPFGGGPVPPASSPFGAPPVTTTYAPHAAPRSGIAPRTLLLVLVAVVAAGAVGWFGWQWWQHRNDLHAPKTLGGFSSYEDPVVNKALNAYSAATGEFTEAQFTMAAYGTGEDSFAFLFAARGDDVKLDQFNGLDGGMGAVDLPGLTRVGNVQCAPVTEQGKRLMMCLRGEGHQIVGVMSTFDIDTTVAMTNEAWAKV